MRQIQETLNRVKVLIEAVKYAREQANTLAVDKVEEGKILFGYIFK